MCKLTWVYGRADAAQQASECIAATLRQAVHSKAHAARPQAAELQRRSLHGLLQQRLQPFAPCTTGAACIVQILAFACCLCLGLPEQGVLSGDLQKD